MRKTGCKIIYKTLSKKKKKVKKSPYIKNLEEKELWELGKVLMSSLQFPYFLNFSNMSMIAL